MGKKDKVSIDFDIPSPYIENDGVFYNFKRKLTYLFAYRLIKKYLHNSKDFKLLEIGTGSGFFLRNCSKWFPFADLYGIEYDNRLFSTTKAYAPTAKCFQQNAESFNLSSKDFNVIVSFQVIEHLYNPEKMLVGVMNHLKKNGIFIVTTPNLNCVSAKFMGKKWHGFRSDHVSLKSYHSWSLLIENLGFEKIYTGSTFFSGIPIMNTFPFGIFNWMMLIFFGSISWSHGESFVGVFKKK